LTLSHALVSPPYLKRIIWIICGHRKQRLSIASLFTFGGIEIDGAGEF
jgi:hypothetical protein